MLEIQNTEGFLNKEEGAHLSAVWLPDIELMKKTSFQLKQELWQLREEIDKVETLYWETNEKLTKSVICAEMRYIKESN